MTTDRSHATGSTAGNADTARPRIKALAVAATGAILLLGACAADRPSGHANYPDRWEYRQGPSDNYGKIYRY